MEVSEEDLAAYVGKSIAEICPNGFSSQGQNHCAHFVSHALGLQLGMLCGDMARKTKGTGASIRCDELFNRLARRGPWQEHPEPADGLLVFVTAARNVHRNSMLNVPQKHVGVHFGGKIYNFSNSQHKVVVDPTVEAFHTKFKHAYAGRDIALFYAATR